MSRACSSCGYDAGFDVTRCPACGAAVAGTVGQPDSDSWEKTVIQDDATPARGERRRVRFDRGGEFYELVAAGGGSPRSGAPASAGPDETIIDRRPGHAADDDATVVMRSGRPKIEGPLGYLIERTGIRAGKVHLLRAETTIGRGTDNAVHLGHESVSKHHAKVRLENGRFVLWDLASTNFSFVVGSDGSRARILEPYPLTDLDTVDLGDARLTFIEVRDREAT